ncbi:hypothetical protein D3C76_550910 [compost metagenome]
MKRVVSGESGIVLEKRQRSPLSPDFYRKINSNKSGDNSDRKNNPNAQRPGSPVESIAIAVHTYIIERERFHLWQTSRDASGKMGKTSHRREEKERAEKEKLLAAVCYFITVADKPVPQHGAGYP